jgi:hypothetical protein
LGEDESFVQRLLCRGEIGEQGIAATGTAWRFAVRGIARIGPESFLLVIQRGEDFVQRRVDQMNECVRQPERSRDGFGA